MTPEQLDEIETLAEAGGFVPRTAAENAYARALRDHALPLVKALREAREVLGLILETDALQHWAFEAGDDGESIYDMVRRAAGKDAL